MTRRTVTISIRPAVAGDLPTVGLLHHRSRRAAYAGLVDPADLDAVPAAGMAQWWTERWGWERDTHRLAVALAGDEVVGFTYSGPSETDGAVELYAIHVEPSRVGSGVGRALMGAAHADLAALGGTGGAPAAAVLWVLTANMRARRFYEHDGWAADGGARHTPMGAALVPQLRYARLITPGQPRA